MGKLATFLVPLFRVLLGLLLLIAGLQKVGEPEVFARSIENYRLLGPQLSSLSALCLPWLEILVGLCLIAGFLTRPSSLLAGGLSLSFGFFVVSALVRGLDIDCGCFTGESKVSWAKVLLDLLMIGMAATVFWKAPGPFSLDDRLSDEDEVNDLLAKLSGVSGTILLIGNLAYFGSQGLPTLAPPPIVPSVTDGRAQIVFDPPVVELGKVLQEKGAQASVIYKNVGTAEARILEVKSSCSCTVPELVKRTLLPGESAELDLAYDPGSNSGEFDQSVLVYLEGQVEPAVLQVTGEVVPTVTLLPTVLELEPEVAKAVRVVSRREGYQPEMKGFTSRLDDLTVRQVGTGTNGSLQLEVLVTQPVPRPPGEQTVWMAKILFEDGPSTLLYVKGKDSQ